MPFDRIELGRVLAEDELGETLEATGVAGDEHVPLRIVRVSEALAADDEGMRRFRDALRIGGALEHPNIVALLDAGTLDGRPFVAFEKVPGVELSRIVARVQEARRRLTSGAALHIVVEVLKGLHHLHARTTPDGEPLRLVHGELSPQRVIALRDGAVKIADVGFAAAQPEARFAAPELVSDGELGPRADVYAAGLLLHTLLAGASPFGAAKGEELTGRILAGVPELSEIRPDLPQPLVFAVGRSVRRDPQKRYATAREFQVVLEEISGGKLDGANLARFLASQLLDPTESAPIEPIVFTLEQRDVLTPEEGGPRLPLTQSSFRSPRKPKKTATGKRRVVQATDAPEKEPTRSKRPTVIRDDPMPARHKPKKRTTAIRQPDAEGRGWGSGGEDPGNHGKDLEREASKGGTKPPAEPAPSRTRASPRTPEPEGEPSRPVRAIAKPIPTHPPAKSQSGFDAISDSFPTARGAAAPEPKKPVDDRPSMTAPHAESAATDGGEPAAPRTPRDTKIEAPAFSAPEPVQVPMPPVVRREAEPSAQLISWLDGHAQAVAAVASAPGGKAALSASSDKTVVLWDLKKRVAERSLQAHGAAVTTLAVSRDGAIAISGGRDKQLVVWDLASGLPTATLGGHKGWILGVDISDDGRRAVSVGVDPLVRVWDLEAARASAAMKGHEESASQVRLLGAAHAVTGGKDGLVRLWDLEEGTLQRSLPGRVGSIRALAPTAHGKRLLLAGAEPGLRLVDLASGEELARFEGHGAPITSIAVSPDGRRAVTAGYDATLRLWDLERGVARATLFGHTGAVLSCAFTADGTILSGGEDKRVGLWRPS